MSKQTDLWMPVYIGDYCRDTQRLTTEQHGAYFLLLLDYWTNGPPPVDDEVLRSITRLKSARFLKHKSTLFSFFTVIDGKLRHKRVDAEIIKAKQHAERRSTKARTAAEARWHGSQSDAPSNATSNALGYAPGCPKPSPSVTNVTGADAPVQKMVFDEGLALLVRSGSSETAARSFLGKCRKAVGDDRALDLIRQCAERGFSEPRAWIAAAMADPANDSAGLGSAITNLAARRAAQST